LLNKLPVTQIAELSNLSKAYISQVKHGKRTPSQKLLEALWEFNGQTNNHNGVEDVYKAIDLFLKSRRNGASHGTIGFYSKYLDKAIPMLKIKKSNSTAHLPPES